MPQLLKTAARKALLNTALAVLIFGVLMGAAALARWAATVG